MRRDAKWMIGQAMSCLGVLALALPGYAGGLDDFKFTRAIPADAAMVMHARDHAGMDFLDTQLERVWKKVEEQHFERDLRTFIRGMAQQEGGDLDEFDQHWQQFNDLLLGVEWSTLFEHECAFAMSMSFPTPEMIVLGRSTSETAQANFEGLEAILKTLMTFAPEGALVHSEQGTGESVVHTLGFPNAQIPIGEIMLAREKDVLLIGFGRVMPEQALALLRGEPGKTLASTERFQAAMKTLPPPTDSLCYLDTARFLGQFRSFADKLMSMQDPTGEELDPQVRALPGRLIDALDIFEYVAAVETTEGLKTTADGIVLLRPDARSKPLYDVIFGNGTLKEPLKFIPERAQNFSVSSGINVQALYDGIIAFIRVAVPNGEGLLAQWEAIKEQVKMEAGIDIEEDVLSWIGGELRTFSIPGRSAYSPPTSVFMLSVRDEEIARETLDWLLEELEPLLEPQGGMIAEAKIEGAEGFVVVVHPMLPLIPGMGQPTLGIKDGQLFFGSSPKAVAAALDTAAGESPNVATNERFLKEGLPVEANLISLEFADLTKLGEELGQILKMVPAIAVFAPQLVQDPRVRALVTAAGKAGRVVQELNFLQSASTRTTFDGNVMYIKVITNYREPPKPKPEPEPTTPAEPESEEPGGVE